MVAINKLLSPLNKWYLRIDNAAISNKLQHYLHWPTIETASHSLSYAGPFAETSSCNWKMFWHVLVTADLTHDTVDTYEEEVGEHCYGEGNDEDEAVEAVDMHIGEHPAK